MTRRTPPAWPAPPRSRRVRCGRRDSEAGRGVREHPRERRILDHERHSAGSTPARVPARHGHRASPPRESPRESAREGCGSRVDDGITHAAPATSPDPSNGGRPMVRKRSARGRGPSRWWRASEALAKIAAGCAALLSPWVGHRGRSERRPRCWMDRPRLGAGRARRRRRRRAMRAPRRAADIEQGAASARNTGEPPPSSSPPTRPENGERSSGR